MKNIVKCLNADCDSFCRLLAFVFACIRVSMLLVKGEENFIIKIASLAIIIAYCHENKEENEMFCMQIEMPQNNKNKECERDAIKIVFLLIP